LVIRVIAARELRSLFVSPLAWVMLAVVQFIIGYLFLTRIELFLQFKPRLLALENPPGLTDIVVAALFGNAGVVLLLVVPLLTMRLISEEHRNGTLPVLLAAPISMTEIVLGKYLGLLTFFIIMAEVSRFFVWLVWLPELILPA
jgi:ABC-2 type transport system permease protein